MGRWSRRAAALVLLLGMVTSVLPAGVELAASPGSTVAPTPTPTPTPTTTPTATPTPTTTPTPTPTPTPSSVSEPTAEPAAPRASAEPGSGASGAATQARRVDTPSAEERKVTASLWMTTSSSWVRFGRSVTVSGRIWAGEQGVAAAPVRIVGLSARTGRWVLLATVESRADGRFTRAFTPLEGYRLKAEVFDSPRLSATASRSRTIVVQPGFSGVRPSGSTHAAIGAEHVVTGAVYAQLAGRRVKLEGLTAAGWSTITHTYVSRSGAFALRHVVRDAAVSRVRVVMPSGGGLLVSASPQLPLRVWSTPRAMAGANLECFGVDAILDASCDARGGAGSLAPTTDANQLRRETGHAYSSQCWQPDRTALVPVCAKGSTRADALRVAFIGDSHAAGYFATMGAEFAYWNWRVDGYFGVSCRWEHVPQGHGCEPRYRQLAAAAASGEYDLVVYTGLRFPYAARPAEAAEIRDRYVRAWQPVVDAGIPLIVMGDFPHIGSGAVGCVTEGRGAAPFDCAVPQDFGQRGFDPALDAAALMPEVRVVDVTRYFCVDGSCPLVIGGAIVYRDAHHLTGTYLTSIASKVMWELRRAAH